MDSTMINNGATNSHAETEIVENAMVEDAEVVDTIRIALLKYRSEKRKMRNLKRELRNVRLEIKRNQEARGIREMETEVDYKEPEIELECPELSMKEELHEIVEKYIEPEKIEEWGKSEMKEYINNLSLQLTEAQQSRRNMKKLQIESFSGKTNVELIMRKKQNLIESSRRGLTLSRKRKLRQDRMIIKKELLEVRGMWGMEAEEEYIEPQIKNCQNLQIKEAGFNSEIKEECIKSEIEVEYMEPEIKEECIKSEIKEEHIKFEIEEEYLELEFKKDCIKSEIMDLCLKSENKKEYREPEIKEECIKSEIKEGCIKSETEEEYLELDFKEGSFKSEIMDQCLTSENNKEYKEEFITSESFITPDDLNYPVSDSWYTQYSEESDSSNTPARIPVQIGNRPRESFCHNCRMNFD